MVMWIRGGMGERDFEGFEGRGWGVGLVLKWGEGGGGGWMVIMWMYNMEGEGVGIGGRVVFRDIVLVEGVDIGIRIINSRRYGMIEEGLDNRG